MATSEGEKVPISENPRLYIAGAIAAAVIAAPVAAVVAGIWWLVWKVASVRWWIPAGVAAVFTGVSLLAVSWQWVSLAGYTTGYGLIGDAVGGSASWGTVVLSILSGQWLVGIAMGSWVAWGYIVWMSRRRADRARRPEEPKPSWWDRRRAKKTIAAIEAGVHGPTAGTTLGVSRALDGKADEPVKYGQRVVITDAAMSGHVLVVGGSGSGKTQSMLSNIRDAIRLGRGVVFVDCKGGPDVPEQLSAWADRYGRDFLHWSITDPQRGYTGPADGPAFYDPISRGDASRRKDLLIGAHKWDVEYYKSVIANYLQTAFRVMDLVPALPGVSTFTDVADLLSPSALVHRARNIEVAANAQLVADLTRMTDMDRQELSGIRSMYSRLHTLIGSTAGAWLRRDPEGLRDIDLRRVADEGQVVVFSLDTSNYEETATLLAGLIVQDLKTLSSELRTSPAMKPMHVYVDEFSAVDSTNILGLLSKARDARMPVMLATQALADLQRTEPTFVDQVLGIVSSFIVHRANTAEDARTMAGLSGLRQREDSPLMGNQGEEFTTAIGRFQRLEMGQCVFISKNPVSQVLDYVQVIPENPHLPSSQREPGVPVVAVPPAVMSWEPEKVTYPHPDAVRGESSPPHVSPTSVESFDGSGGEISPSPTRPVRPGRVGASQSAGEQDSPSIPAAGRGKPAGSPIPGVSTHDQEDSTR